MSPVTPSESVGPIIPACLSPLLTWPHMSLSGQRPSHPQAEPPDYGPRGAPSLSLSQHPLLCFQPSDPGDLS